MSFIRFLKFTLPLAVMAGGIMAILCDYLQLGLICFLIGIVLAVYFRNELKELVDFADNDKFS